MKLMLALLKKDLLGELRVKETISLLASLAILLSVLCAFGVGDAFLEEPAVRRVFPILLWLVFVFTATVSIGKIYDLELEHRAHEGVLLAGASPAAFFLSKFVTAAALVSCGHLISLCALGVLLDIRLGAALWPLLGISLLVVFGYCALAVLLGAIAGGSKLRSMLLPVLLLPLLFPLFFAALELSFSVLVDGAFQWSSPWFSLLVGLDAMYFVLALNLYEYVLKE
jgi:heme exporter protein B